MKCQICGGYELADGTEEADWNPCFCEDEEEEKESPQMSPEMKNSVLKVIDDLLAMPPEELKKLLDERPYDPNSLGAMIVRAKYGMNESEKEPRTTWLPTQNIRAFSDPTEPNLHPHLFTAFVPKSSYDALKAKYECEPCDGCTKGHEEMIQRWKEIENLRKELKEMTALKEKAADIAIALGFAYNERVKERDALEEALKCARFRFVQINDSPKDDGIAQSASEIGLVDIASALDALDKSKCLTGETCSNKS